MSYKGFDFAQKPYGIELYLPKSTQIFNTINDMKKYVDLRLRLES